MSSVAPVDNTDNPQHLTQTVVQQACSIILGKEQQIRLALACLLSKGHLLIEDLPGVGKTTLAHVFAKILGLDFSRIQFTSDLLPADILGVSIFDHNQQGFQFQAGPIFSQLILADEVNRATPKAQSALLEAMEEKQVSLEGKTHALPEPFFVIATQNPTHQIGTFPLPESQLDRFLIRIGLGYPDKQAERALLAGQDRRDMLERLDACINQEQLLGLQQHVGSIHVSDALLDYVQTILDYTRNCAEIVNGLSPRAGLALLHCAKAWAMMEGRDHVIPEDIQTILPHVVGHRLRAASDMGDMDKGGFLEKLIELPIP